MLESNGELTDNARTLLRDMERYASGMGCRHRELVEYFGEPYAATDCGACDWCLKELDPVADAKIVAQKILSCVARVKQTWGIGHVTDILVGRATEKVVAAGHAGLSTFGLLTHEPAAAVRGYVEQLVDGGFLTRAGDAVSGAAADGDRRGDAPWRNRLLPVSRDPAAQDERATQARRPRHRRRRRPVRRAA